MPEVTGAVEGRDRWRVGSGARRQGYIKRGFMILLLHPIPAFDPRLQPYLTLLHLEEEIKPLLSP